MLLTFGTISPVLIMISTKKSVSFSLLGIHYLILTCQYLAEEKLFGERRRGRDYNWRRRVSATRCSVVKLCHHLRTVNLVCEGLLPQKAVFTIWDPPAPVDNPDGGVMIITYYHWTFESSLITVDNCISHSDSASPWLSLTVHKLKNYCM